jgi:hypothetical protein
LTVCCFPSYSTTSYSYNGIWFILVEKQAQIHCAEKINDLPQVN